MRPPHFGQDITNTQNNNNNSSGGDEDGSNDRTRQEYIINRLTQNGATPVAHIAGKGIIRVVSRCEDAKENSNLGKLGNVMRINASLESDRKVKSAIFFLAAWFAKQISRKSKACATDNDFL